MYSFKNFITRMERIVNGYYDDPNSTRDIRGILPNEFNVIVRALQAQYKAYSALLLASDEERLRFAELAAIATGTTINKSNLKDLSSIKVRLYVAMELGSIDKILTDINQPYPGDDLPG